VNFLYNKYIIAYDTNSLFFSIKDNQANANLKNKANSFDNPKHKNKKLFDINHHIKIPSKPLKSSKFNFGFGTKSFNLLSNKEINNPKIKIKINYTNNNNINTKNYINTNNIMCTNNNDNEDDNRLEKADSPDKGKNKFNTFYNSSNVLLNENQNSIIMNKLKKENNYLVEVCKKMDLNKINDSRGKLSNKDYIKKIFVSRGGISRIDHIKKQSNENIDEQLKSIKYFTVIDYFRSLLFKKEKESHNFLRIFRKHLLSEEHLLKAHLKIIF
jgi:hypothetical protein